MKKTYNSFIYKSNAIGILFVLLNFICSSSNAQDVEKIIKSKTPIKVNGGLNLDNVFYKSYGISDRRNSPYQYFVNGNINFTILDEFVLPLNFSYSNQKFNYKYPFNQQQFNQFGCSPRYKWITAHIGWRNMTFSPYSLNGHTFLGGGIELNPGKIKIQFMHGRLLKAVASDTLQLANSNTPSYERMGIGGSLAYEDNGNKYSLSVFQASDKYKSLVTPLDSLGIKPLSNAVFNGKVVQKLNKYLQVDLELAKSIITTDTRLNTDPHSNKSLKLIKENASTVSYNALKTSFTLNVLHSKIGMTYEKIDPGYKTLGAYFFNNDLQNITVNFSKVLFKDKISLQFNLGRQRNNLDKSKISTMKRWVGDANVTWKLNEKISNTFTYSNFQTYTNIISPFVKINEVTPYQNLDSMNYVQVTQNLGINSSIILKATKKQKQQLIISANSQSSSEKQGGLKTYAGMKFYTGMISHSISFDTLALSISTGFNINSAQNKIANTLSYGPSITLNKKLFNKKLSTYAGVTWNTSEENKNNVNVFLYKLGSDVVIKKKNKINLSFIYLNKESSTKSNAFKELTLRLSYILTF